MKCRGEPLRGLSTGRRLTEWRVALKRPRVVKISIANSKVGDVRDRRTMMRLEIDLGIRMTTWCDTVFVFHPEVRVVYRNCEWF